MIWKVRAMPSAVRRWLGQSVTSRPNSSTCPDDAGKMPVMRLNSVVLPAPFGPMIALRSPGMTLRRDVAHGVQAAEALRQALQLENRRVAVRRSVGVHLQFSASLEGDRSFQTKLRSMGRQPTCRICRADSRGCRPASPGTPPS